MQGKEKRAPRGRMPAIPHESSHGSDAGLHKPHRHVYNPADWIGRWRDLHGLALPLSLFSTLPASAGPGWCERTIGVDVPCKFWFVITTSIRHCAR